MKARRLLAEKILLVEMLGIFTIIAVLWLDELLDLPHFLFGMETTPVNWAESLLESVLVVVLGLGIVTWTDRVLSRIQYLEGFLQMCSRCKRVRVGRRWAPIEEFLSDEAPVTVSGGLCEHCMEEHRDADLGKR